MDKFLIHCDMNNYFASVEMLDNPYLEDIPFVVSGDVNLRHGIVLSKNDPAKKYKIATGESVFEAKKKYKDVVIINADYQKYLKYTKLSRSIYARYTDYIYPYGMDEAWLDVTERCKTIDEARLMALNIKKTIHDELGLAIACGVSFNYIFSKLGSDQKLKDDVFVVSKEEYLEKTEYMPAFNLLFVGSKTRSTLKRLNILTIGDLRRAEPLLLKGYLGKKGLILHEFAFGDDSNFNPVTENDEDIKSISNTITSPKDITNIEEAKKFIFVLSNITSKRLKKHNLQAKTIFLGLKYNDFSVFSKQKTLENYSNKQEEIYNMACYILSLSEEKKLIRSMTLRLSNLTIDECVQLSLFDNDSDDELDRIIERLMSLYGNINIERTSASKDWEDE